MKVPVRPDMSLYELPAPQEKLLEPPHPHHKILFIVLLVLFIGAGIFMLFFTLHDAKEKKVYPQTQMSITTPVPTNPQDNWQTYTDTKAKFSLKYPSGYTLYSDIPETPNTVRIIALNLPENKTNFVLDINYKPITSDVTLIQLINQNKPCTNTVSSKSVSSLNNTMGMPQQAVCGTYLKSARYIINGGIFYSITVESPSNYNVIKKHIDDLLGTMTFSGTNTDVSPIPSISVAEPVGTSGSSMIKSVCTQEAKQCPDGSMVGRTGPNCTFAACPIGK